MSMYEMEDYITAAVDAVAQSKLEPVQKRSIIRALFVMESQGDCSFTQRRNLPNLLACQYTFQFPPRALFDYRDRRNYYDRELPSRNWDSTTEPYLEKGLVCVDSGTEVWRGMVQAGSITGAGAEELLPVSPVEAMRAAAPLLGPLDEELREGAVMAACLTGAEENLAAGDYKLLFGMSQEEFEEIYED